MDEKKPPMGASTRWAGIIPMISWMNSNRAVLEEYNIRHPKDCAVLEDGTTYTDHAMGDEDWEIISQLVSCYEIVSFLSWLCLLTYPVQQEGILSPFTLFMQVMQQTLKPTISLVLPVIGKLISMLNRDRKFAVLDYSSGSISRKMHIKVRACE